MKTRVKYSSAVASIINRAGSRAISFDDLGATSIGAGAAPTMHRSSVYPARISCTVSFPPRERWDYRGLAREHGIELSKLVGAMHEKAMARGERAIHDDSGVPRMMYWR